MHIELFITLFVTTLAVLLISMLYQKEQAYQVIISFLALIMSIALTLSAFNIEIIEQSGGIFYTKQIYDYGYIGIGLAFIIISFVNILIILFVGSLEMFLHKGGR